VICQSERNAMTVNQLFQLLPTLNLIQKEIHQIVTKKLLTWFFKKDKASFVIARRLRDASCLEEPYDGGAA
jgi:hypothetical protein